MSYTRQLYDAVRDLTHYATRQSDTSIEFMAKQMRRNGIDEGTAESEARRQYYSNIFREVVKLGVFGFALQMLWNLGAYVPYLILGNDEQTKDEFWNDVWTHSMFGSIEGLTGGDVMSAGFNMAVQGDINRKGLEKNMPAASDVLNILDKFKKDDVAALNDIFNLIVQSGVGMNPQSITDAAVAIIDCCGGDLSASRECALLIARILNCPQSQLDKIYFDEIDMLGTEASKLGYVQLAERYARYKTLREAPLTGWMRSDEEDEQVMEGKRKRIKSIAKKKIEQRYSTEQTRRLIAWHDSISRAKREANALFGEGTTAADNEEGQRRWNEELSSVDWEKHYRIGQYKRDMKELTQRYLDARSVEEAKEITDLMESTRQKMLQETIE
ncbi:MAG: hypothetical protein HDT09_02295 [Bacteroidales bacterium]|nr:hypothetical protein [Bacteroidales bacterium]